MTIWKFDLQYEDEQSVIMPAGADVLHAGEQRGQICVWALVCPDARKVNRRFSVRGTGHPCEGLAGRYVGTAMCAGGSLVFHVFDRGEVSLS